MNRRNLHLALRAAAWLLGLVLLTTGLQAAAQQDPPGVVGSLTFREGTVSFSPSGDNDWFDVVPNRPLTSGDRLWTDRGARAEVHVGSIALRLDEQTGIALSEIDDNTVRITVLQGTLQLRVRDDPAGRRLEVDTENLAVVVDAPGDLRIEASPADGTTRVAVAAGQVTLFGEGGESLPLGARQQLTTSGRNLEAVSGAPVRATTAFDRWVAERDQIDDQSISARYVSTEVVGYQQLDNYGDWQSDPSYGEVWYPRDVSADWAPYSDGQWVDIAPWGWTWIDAAPWGFAPAHYGRWARIGPRWGWVPGRPRTRPVYAPALVGFVGGAGGANVNLAIGNGRNGIGWFPLAPGEAWRPGYRASERYVDEANRAALQRQAVVRNGFANQQMPGAVTVVPADTFGHGPIGHHNVVRLPPERLGSAPVAMGAPIPPPYGGRGAGGLGHPTAAAPPPAAQARQQQPQFPQIQQFPQAQQAQQAVQLQQAQRLQQETQQRAAQAQAQQAQQVQRQQQEFQQRAAQAQAQQALQLQQAQRLQQETQQRAAQAQAQQALQVQQAQQMQSAQRQQQEMQQRAAQMQMQAAQQQQMLHAQQQIQAQQRALQGQVPSIQQRSRPEPGQFTPDRP